MKKKKKKRVDSGVKYDPLITGTIQAPMIVAYCVYLPDGERRILLWPPGATLTYAHDHFKRTHPELPEFRIGVLGVGEYLVDAVDHGWIPDARSVDQDGLIVVDFTDPVIKEEPRC